MPWHDWQFWIVTLATLGAAALLLRQFLPRQDGNACPACAAGAAACAKPEPQAPRLVQLGGRPRV